MKEYIFSDENRAIRQYTGAEVKLDIDGDCRLEFDYRRETSLLYIRRKSYYSEKLAHCDDIDALVQRLTLPPVVKPIHTTNKRKNTLKTAQEAADNNERDATSQTPQSVEKPQIFAVEDCEEVIVFDNDGNITERSRSVEGIKRTYNAIREKVESTAKSCNSFFISPTLDTYPTFDEMSKVAADYAVYLKRKYGNFKAGFIFLEPCEDGSWHAHLILCFYDSECQTFEDDTLKWWSKKNKKTSEYQVTVRQIIDLEDLEHTLDYLNPLSDKQDNEDDGKTSKRERIHFYPLWCKPMRCFGEVVGSVKGTATKDVIDALGIKEYDIKRRKRTEVLDLQTGEMPYFVEEFVFIVKGLDKHPNNTVTTADSNKKERSKCVQRQKCKLKRQCEHCPFFKAEDLHKITIEQLKEAIQEVAAAYKVYSQNAI